jgi:hypothetical protein
MAVSLVLAVAPSSAAAASPPTEKPTLMKLGVDGSSFSCPIGYLCLWVGQNYTGSMYAWRATGYEPDFRTLSCGDPTCNTGTFDNEASSWHNNATGRTMCVSTGYGGAGQDNSMPDNTMGNFSTTGWNDIASSLSNSGCP